MTQIDPDMRGHGRRYYKKPGTRTFYNALRLTDSERERVVAEARSRHISVSGLVSTMLSSVIEHDLFRAVLED